MDYVIALGRRQRKRQAVHQQLLDTAQQLFHERGVARTTVEDIAEAADVARQTVFNHFPYKEAMALELAADNIQDVAHQAQALLEAGVPALEVLQRSAERVLEMAIREGELSVVVARELLHTDPDRVSRATQQVPLAEIFEAILVQAREEGTLRNDLPVDVLANRVCAVVRTIIAQILSSSAEQLRQELAVCFDVVFNGIIDRRR